MPSLICKYIFIYYASLSSTLFCQNSLEGYFNNNSINLNNVNSKKSYENLNFLAYNAFFFGENHSSEKVIFKEIFIINILKKKLRDIFIEYPIGYNYSVQEYLNLTPIDTTTEDFEFYSGNNKAQEILLRYIYIENQKKVDSLKLHLFHIDMIDVKDVNIDDLLLFFRKKIKPKQVKKGFNYLKLIKTNNIKSEDSLINQYLLFRKNFYSNLPIYSSYFGKYFIEMEKDIDGIYIYSLAVKEDTSICVCRSNSREEFMLNNILSQLKKDSIKSFISINGASHVITTFQKEWDFMQDWESLATKFKKHNSFVKTCSIYFMDSNNDNLGDQYFPTEKKIILDNIKEGETYLIRLDGEGSPFKELSKKFQYIVVW
jgi:hypothetical protein